MSWGQSITDDPSAEEHMEKLASHSTGPRVFAAKAGLDRGDNHVPFFKRDACFEPFSTTP